MIPCCARMYGLRAPSRSLLSFHVSETGRKSLPRRTRFLRGRWAVAAGAPEVCPFFRQHRVSVCVIYPSFALPSFHSSPAPLSTCLQKAQGQVQDTSGFMSLSTRSTASNNPSGNPTSPTSPPLITQQQSTSLPPSHRPSFSMAHQPNKPSLLGDNAHARAQSFSMGDLQRNEKKKGRILGIQDRLRNQADGVVKRRTGGVLGRGLVSCR